jgi:hypothetical protein
MCEPYDPHAQMRNTGVSHGFMETRKSRRRLDGAPPGRSCGNPKFDWRSRLINQTTAKTGDYCGPEVRMWEVSDKLIFGG